MVKGIIETQSINEVEQYIGNHLFPLSSEFVYKNIQREKDETWSDFRADFGDTILYTINPKSLTKPFPILPNNSFVKEDASNLVAFLDTIQGRYRDHFEAIEKDLQKCIPEFSRIELDPVEIKQEDDLFKIYGDKTFKRLGLYDTKGKKTYWADEVSEGVLYFLALLCIVHQPNPPKLLLLEEPEKGIHPRRIKEVLDFIFQLAEDKDIQVIMTTHNERVLDEFEDIPDPRPEDGYFSRASFVADNDLAIGRIMHFLSRTPYWKNMLVIITEDDPQGGVDHIDAHRSVLMLASPYIKRRYVSNTHANFGSVLKTIYTILHVPYVNQYDVTASLLQDFFTTKPDFRPYTMEMNDPRVFDVEKAMKKYHKNINWKKVMKGLDMVV